MRSCITLVKVITAPACFLDVSVDNKTKTTCNLMCNCSTNDFQLFLNNSKSLGLLKKAVNCGQLKSVLPLTNLIASYRYNFHTTPLGLSKRNACMKTIYLRNGDDEYELIQIKSYQDKHIIRQHTLPAEQMAFCTWSLQYVYFVAVLNGQPNISEYDSSPSGTPVTQSVHCYTAFNV
jgi:hypothetical protein